jgi:hypothetical protein
MVEGSFIYIYIYIYAYAPNPEQEVLPMNIQLVWREKQAGGPTYLKAHCDRICIALLSIEWLSGIEQFSWARSQFSCQGGGLGSKYGK